MSWTEEKIAKLKELWGSKEYTASQIAEILGGMSRNAVIGKAHRLNLSAKIKTRSATSNQSFENSTEEKNFKSRKGRKSKFKSLIIEKDFEPENPKQLEELDENSCKWPIGHPNEGDFYFCGRSSIKGYSYCRLHVLYSFQIRGDNKEDGLNTEEAIPKFIEEKIKSAGVMDNPYAGAFKSGWNLGQEFVNMYLGHGGEFFKSGSEGAACSPRAGFLLEV